MFRGNEESKENGYSSGRYAGAERANARREESKKVSFADDTKKSAGQGQDDPVTRHADEDMPDDLCSRSLRTASKSLLLTSIASIFTLCYCVLLAHAGSFPEKGTQGHQGLLVISCLSILVWTTELVIKAAGLGLRQYARNLWNLLDCACLLSLVIDVGIVQGVSFAYLRIFKISRPLQRYQPVAIFQSTIDSICRALKLLPPILGLLGLFILLCAVFGSQFFGASGDLTIDVSNPKVWYLARGILSSQHSGCKAKKEDQMEKSILVEMTVDMLWSYQSPAVQILQTFNSAHIVAIHQMVRNAGKSLAARRLRDLSLLTMPWLPQSSSCWHFCNKTMMMRLQVKGN